MINIKTTLKGNLLIYFIFLLLPTSSFSQTLTIPFLHEVTKNTEELKNNYPDGVINKGGSLTIFQAFTGTYAPTQGISGFGKLVIDTSGGDAVILSGLLPSFSGETIIEAGGLQGNISPNSSLNLSGVDAVYTLNGTDQASLSLSGSAQSIINLGSNTLTANQNSNTEFAGQIRGLGSLVVAGSGTLTLSGDNSYEGKTTINAGGTLIGTITSGSVLALSGANATYTLTTDQVIHSLTGEEGSIINLGANTLSVGGNDLRTTFFKGVIQDGPSGEGGNLVIQGEGGLKLTAQPTYTGSTFTVANLSGPLPPTTALLVEASGTGEPGSYNLTQSQQLGSLSGNGNVLLSSFNLTTGGNNTSSTFSGIISGTGSLTQTGSGTLTFTGGNIYTGGTTINLGSTLSVNSNSLPSGGNTTDNGTLIFNQSGQASNATFSGTISGSGTLIVESGSVNFTGTIASSITKKTQNGGNLTGNTDSITGNIIDNGTVTFNQITAGTYAGKISGTGSLIKDGEGRLALTGVSPLTGPTTIKKGILAVNGSLENSVVTVAQEGILRGSGTVGGVHLIGTVAPGNSIGTLKIRNDFIMEPTSTYAVEITPNKIKPRDADHLMIGGKANLAGTLHVKILGGARRTVKNQRFMCLGAKKGRFGEFSNLISDDRLKYKVLYFTKGIEVFVTSLQDFADAFPPGNNSNPARTARYFDTFADNTAGRPDLTHVINILDGLLLTENTPLVNNAFNQIQPAQYGDLGGISFLHNELVNKTVSTQQQYLRESRWIDTELRNREGAFANFSPKELSNFRKLVDDKLLSGFNTFEQVSKNQIGPRVNFLALGGETKAMRPGNQRIRVGKSSLWVQSYGQIEKSKSNHGNPSIRSQTGGLSIGGDHEILCNTYLGILGGFSTTPFHWGQDRGYGRMKSYYGGLYGTWLSQTGLYADGQIIAGGDQFHSKRNIKFPGINRIAKQSHKAGQFSANAEVGYAWMLQPFTLQPFLDGTYMFAKEQGFREKGAQSLNFNIKSKTSQFLRGEVGAQIYRTYVLCDALVRPAFQLSYVHKHPISGTHVKGGLVGEPQTLTLLGDSKVRNQVAPGVGVTVQFAKGLYIIANVSAQLGSGQNLGDALVRVGYDF